MSGREIMGERERGGEGERGRGSDRAMRKLTTLFIDSPIPVGIYKIINMNRQWPTVENTCHTFK